MALNYKVWVEIEEFDDETGEGRTCDSIGASVVSYADLATAERFAALLQSVGENLSNSLPEAAVQAIDVSKIDVRC